MFDVVDEDDNVVGKAGRSRCHGKHLPHRSVMFFIFDRQNRVFVNRRSSEKEFFGGRYSIVFGGHVPAGETYDDAVVRELAEEASLTDKPFKSKNSASLFDRWFATGGILTIKNRQSIDRRNEEA